MSRRGRANAIGLYRENAIGRLGCRPIDQSGFARKECNLHCDEAVT